MPPIFFFVLIPTTQWKRNIVCCF